MAYDLKSEIDKVLKFKQDWGIADNVTYSVNGKNAKDHIKNEAQKVYDRMKANGYGAVANNLQSKDYAGAKKYADSFYIKTGRSAFRPYFYQKGKEWGMPQEDIDKLIHYDNDTGEISFAGKNIGKPAGVVDGVSYMDAEAMQKVWDDYTAENGLSRSPEKLAGKNSEDAGKMARELFDISKEDSNIKYDKYGKLESYIYDHDPYSSDIGKSIMEDYQLRGDKAADGAVAERAGANSGNIDSFAAANAARQQLAFTNAGKQAVLADFNSRIENIRGALSDMGVQIQTDRNNMYNAMLAMQNEAQRLSENVENSKLNHQQIEKSKVDNLVKQAAVNGYTPKEWRDSDNPYLNKDGTLKDAGIDYNARITQLENALKTETDPASIERIKRNIGWLNDARAVKVTMPEYKKYASDRPVIFSDRERTAEYDMAVKQIESGERIANAGYDTERVINKDNVDANVLINRESQNAETARNSADNATTQAVAGMQADVEKQKVYADMGVVNAVKIPEIDEDNADAFGINENGVKLLKDLKLQADSEGGLMTNQDILKFVVDNAGKYRVNLADIEKIYGFLGISIKPLERFTDASKVDLTKGIMDKRNRR